MTIPRNARWRIALVLAGVATAIGGSQHPESDAEDSLRDELAAMTASDTWVLSHTLLAIGTALLAVGLWSAHRNEAWPRTARRSLRIAAVAMSLYVVETVLHLASAVDADALADGDAAPIAFTHVGLALFLYPVSGLALAWLSLRLLRVAALPGKVYGVIGVVGGLIHASSVPLTIVLPDAELSPMFAAAGILFAVWSFGLGLVGLGRATPAEGSTATPHHQVDVSVAAGSEARGTVDARDYRLAEHRYWRTFDALPSDRRVDLPGLGTQVRVQELGGDGEPLVYLHGAPNAGTTWAPLAARLDGYRSILVDRPGAGLSQDYSLTADGLDAFADRFLVDLLDALELERAHVVASSFGGFLALRGAAVAPERFDRMVQMGCPAGAPGMVVPPFMRAAAVPLMRHVIAALPPNERAARTTLRQIGHGTSIDADAFSSEFMDWYLSLQRNTSTMRNDLRMLAGLVTVGGGMHPSLQLSEALLRGIRVPTTFYWGHDDPFGGHEVAQRTVELIDGAQLEMVAHAGHLPWLDDPAHAARSVEDCLRSRIPSGSAEHGGREPAG